MNILVTGSSRGIGLELVKSFAIEGNHKIIALARNGKKLSDLQKQCESLNPKTKVYALAFDLEKNSIEQELIPVIREFLSHLDVVIFNAGYLVNKAFFDISEEDFDRTFNVNVKSIFRLTQVLLPYFSTDTHLITISSMGGYQGSSKFPGLSVYSASKGALAVLTECLAEELKPMGVKVNCLAIGAVQTEMLEEAFPGYKAPLQASEMADFIADFAQNGQRFFNGKILPVSLSTP